MYARDYDAATALIDKLPLGLISPRAHIYLSNRTIAELVLGHVTQSEELESLLAAAREALFENATDEELASGAPLIAIALFAALEGLVEPSGVMPFFDPYLPFFDTVRDEPVFVELVEELENST